METPKISVIMPVWNGEAYLREAVESILAQTFRDFEFIILDDGSTDSTPAILERFRSADARVRLIRLDHEGIVIALNHGVKESRAKWIARMDCDDIAHPDRLARQWSAIQADPEIVLCHTNIRIIGEPRYVTPAGWFVQTPALLRLRLCFQCLIVHPTVMFCKSTFDACGGYVPAERHAEDFGLWGRLIGRGKVVGIPQVSLDFRVHGNSISKQKAETQEQVSRPIALLHCARFLGIGEQDALRANSILRGEPTHHALSEWFWLVLRVLPMAPIHSMEMWAWVASQTLRRSLLALSRRGSSVNPQ